MSIPNTMRALILQAPGQLSLQEVPVPKPGPGEILLRVKAATSCGTDLKAWTRGHAQIPMPGPLGHEYSGVVADAGTDATFAVGDEVMGVHSAPCQTCYWCERDQENLCESVMKTKVLGTFAEFLLIPARIARLNLFRKPSALADEIASLLEPLACVAQGIRELQRVRALERRDASILIIGPGAIGLMFVAALRHEGFENVTLAGRNRNRLAVGEQLGAKVVPSTQASPLDGRGYDIVIECTGQVDVWEKSIDYVRRGGSLMLFGGCKGGSVVSFRTDRVHYDQISILSPFHFGTQAVRQAFDWLADLAKPLSLLITGHASLEEGNQVFQQLSEGNGIKVAFHP